MTPAPLQGGNFGVPNWGPSHDNYPSEFSGVKGHHYSNPSTGYNNGGANNYNPNNFEMEFDTKYSPSRGTGGGYHNNNNRELSSQ